MNRIRIEEYGRFFQQNEWGYLLNDCEINNLKSPWLELVETWKQNCLSIFNPSIISIYLRGSIPRGLAIEGFSDLDGIIIIDQNYIDNDHIKIGLSNLEKNLRSKFPFCTGIETQIITEKDLFNPEYDWGVLLKIQGLCLWGVDYQLQLPPVSISKNLITHSFSLEQDIVNICQWLREMQLSDSQEVTKIKHKCSWLSKRIVRSGFELVMEQENVYTRDLYLNYAVFARYFPEKEMDMRRMLSLAILPSSNRSGLLVFWREFGSWLLEKINHKFA